MRKTLFPPSKKTNATGVILSGMGLDGTLGLRAIKAGRADEDLMEKAQTGLQTHFTDRTAELDRARENSPSAASTHGRKKP